MCHESLLVVIRLLIKKERKREKERERVKKERKVQVQFEKFASVIMKGSFRSPY